MTQIMEKGVVWTILHKRGRINYQLHRTLLLWRYEVSFIYLGGSPDFTKKDQDNAPHWHRGGRWPIAANPHPNIEGGIPPPIFEESVRARVHVILKYTVN